MSQESSVQRYDEGGPYPFSAD